MKIYQINRYPDQSQNEGKIYSVHLQTPGDVNISLALSIKELIAMRDDLNKAVQDNTNSNIVHWKGSSW